MPKLMKFSLRSLSTVFSWQRKQHRKGTSGRAAEEMMRSESEVKELISVDTELPVIERENRNQHQHHQCHLSYTSLRDLMLTSRPISPIKQRGESLTGDREQQKVEDAAADPHWPGGARLPIKNRLVEQAARAYLLPAGAQSTPSNQFFACYWAKFTTAASSSSSSSRLHSHPSHEDLYASVHGSGDLDSCSDCNSFSCLPSFLWLDLTRIFRCLFSNVRPQSVGFLQAS